jgi:hypothetical protein
MKDVESSVFGCLLNQLFVTVTRYPKQSTYKEEKFILIHSWKLQLMANLLCWFRPVVSKTS